ncbi:MAG: S1-like domain-containing RNA-binding protein [Thermodesulfobacteriota bacterium]|nr:S1-like domain-containing RNA-binding protein [Thermodesulfobacteriota bacterium]
MADIGGLNTLTIVRKLDQGAYLDGNELGEILLPGRYVPEDCTPGDTMEVFIYIDSEGLRVATTERPYAMVGQIARLEVVEVNSSGAFLDWGLPKDLLVPFREQKQRMETGRSYIVFVYLDHKTKRIAASSRLDSFLDTHPASFDEGQEVELFICDTTDLGYKVIIDDTHWGMLYKNEVFQSLTQADRVKGFIKKIREDQKIDVCLQKPGYEKVAGISQKIIDMLRKQGGFIPVTDKSSPDIIYEMFGISKKTYKKVVGALYRKRLIVIESNGIRLTK